MSLFGSLSQSSLLSLQFTIIDDLHASHVFLLHGPQSLFLLPLLLKQLLLDNLLVTFMKNGSLLLIIETLEVVGLHAVRSEHRSHGRGVLSHEIIGQRICELMGLLLGPVLTLSMLCITLLLG